MTPSTTEGLLRELPPHDLESAFNGRMEQRFFHSAGMAARLGYTEGLRRFYSEATVRALLSTPASPVQGLPPEVEAACRAIESREAQRKREASTTLPTPAETVVAYLRSLAALNKEGE